MKLTYNVTLRSVRESLLPLAVCARVRVLASGYQGVRACTRAYVPVALLIQHATRMRHIGTSFVALRSSPHISTLSHKRCYLKKKVIEYKMRVFIFSRNFV